MLKIWNEMNKPEKYLKANLFDFFTFEYCFLPSPKFEGQLFASSLKALKARFDQTKSSNFFENTRNQSRVPMDGYAYFINQMW
jgi:hypothetical protein